MDQNQGPRRIGGDRVSPAAQKMTSEREAQILELRLRKVSFEKIGQTVGVTKSAAAKAYYRALNRIPLRHAKEVITEEVEALDRLESRLWREFEKLGVDVKNLCAVADRVLHVKRRRAKLLGLDQPQLVGLSVLKQSTADDDNAALMEQQMLECLALEDKQALLALLSKISAREALHKSFGSGINS
jgi:hypothetical protein